MLDRSRHSPAPTADREIARARTGGMCAVLLAALGAFAAGPSAAASPAMTQDDEGPNANLFQLYDTQAARSRAAQAEEHIAAARWAEAIAELQALIEDHAGEVLGGTRPQAAGAKKPSQQDVHPGAGAWAVGKLFALPSEGRAFYRRRYAERAERALERAIAGGDRGALARIAQRWPITEAAPRAWWALGDLEVELGHTADGLRAWARAAAIGLDQPDRRCRSIEDWQALRSDVEADDASPAGATARLDFAIRVLPEVGDAATSAHETEATFVLGPATGVAADAFGVRRPLRRPGDDDRAISGWATPYPLPYGPFREDAGCSRIFPQRHGDLVFVNTSRSLHALNAFDGSEAWVFGEDRLDWNGVRNLRDFGEAVDTDEHIVTVAASRGIVVAALQIPVVYERKDQYQDLQIIDVIPERRLIACDAQTGEVLWHTMPPEGWDGESGSFKDRMTVVGPPVAVGARVLVPMARLRGRIELHLGCLDLTDGSVLWSAPLVTGQRELNMFGRATKEFSAPPPLVVGDTVVMQTQLGLIAAVDLFTGETLWDTVYEQVRVHAPQYYQAGFIESRWRNAPPVVTGETIVAAPQDGKDLLGLDLATGSVIWSYDQEFLMRQLQASTNVRRSYRRRGPARSLLFGADEDRVYLGGTSVLAVEFPRGVRSGPPVKLAWRWPEDQQIQTEAAIPVMDAGSVFVPDITRLARLDRRTGRLEEQVDGAVASGNVLVSGGMLFSTNGRRVEARFEWHAMVARARTAAEEDGATLGDVRTLSRLLLERAESLIARGREVKRGIELAEESLDWLERFGGRTRAGEPVTAESRGLSRDVHRALMAASRGHRTVGAELGEALARRALALAEAPDARLEALLVLQEEVSSQVSAGTARAALLAEILAAHGEEPVTVSARSTPGWSWESAFRDVLAARGEGAPERAGDPWRDPWRLEPIPLLAASGGVAAERVDHTEAEIPAGLFVRIAQAMDARRGADVEERLSAELDALHSVLVEHPEVQLFGTRSDLWAASRIQSIRVLWPSSEAVARIEARAREAFDAAMGVARETGSTEDLELLPVLFPGSVAARRAADARIQFALENGAPAEVAAIVSEALPRDWHPGSSSPEDTRMLLGLAETLGGVGNRAFRAGVAKNLAAFAPDQQVPRPGSLPGSGPLTLSELADAWTARAPERGASRPVPGFDADVVETNRFKGNFGAVGFGALEDGTEVALMASQRQLLAVPSGRAGRPLWQRSVLLSSTKSVREAQVVVDGSRVIVADTRRVTCLSLESGELLWTFLPPDRGVGSIEVDSGVCVVLTTRGPGREPAEIHALDAVEGVELWQLGSISGFYLPVLKVGDGRLVLFPLKTDTAAVHDLFTGFPVAAIETGRTTSRQARPAWIDRGRLVVPFLEAGPSRGIQNAIVAYELTDGVEAWRIGLDNFRGARRQLLGIIDMPYGEDGRQRIAMLEDAGEDRRSSGFSLRVIDEERGRFGTGPRYVVDASKRLYGVPGRRRVVLDAPVLLVASESPTSESTRLEALGPDLRPLWKVSSPRRVSVAGARDMPLPVHTGSTVAMIVKEAFGSRTNEGMELKLMFLDAASGKHVETRRLETPGQKSGNWRTLEGFGDTLLVAGSVMMSVME